MINEVTCIIVDDEIDAIELLSARIQKFYKNISILGYYTSWDTAFNVLRTHAPDILMLDISMPEKTGLDLLRLLPGIKSEVIFTTAHREYAIDAFKFSAVGYLLKPVDDEDLITTINKAIERIQNKKTTEEFIKSHKIINTKIGIPNINGVDYINTEDILYFETINGYTRVVTKNGDILSSYSIGKFKTIVEGYSFYQPHRSYIVNINSVTRYTTSGILIMQDKKEIPVSKMHKDELFNLFNVIARKTNT